MRISKGLKQAYDLQDLTYQAAMALKVSLSRDGQLSVTREDAVAIKALVSSWEAAQMRVAFHRRVPSPGALKHAAPKKGRSGTPVARPIVVIDDDPPADENLPPRPSRAPLG